MPQDTSAKIMLEGLTPLQAEELRQEMIGAGCDPAAIELRKDVGGVTGSRKGEPVTLFVIVALSSIAMTGLSIYLAKKRSHESKEETLTITLPDGTKVTHTLRTSGSAEEIKADVMGKISSLKIPFPKAT